MYKLNHLCDALHFGYCTSIPIDMHLEINRILKILDDTYGINRDIKKDLGGFVVIIESDQDVKALNDSMSVHLETATFEYVDKVSGYLGCLLLLGSDYHLYIVLPYSIAPLNVLRQINP